MNTHNSSTPAKVKFSSPEKLNVDLTAAVNLEREKQFNAL